MNIFETIVFFMICWWMVFYITLPFGIRDEDNPIAGQAKSAPKNPYIKQKMLISTALTVIITLIFKYLVFSR